MADTAISPTFEGSLQINHLEQLHVRGQEAWGRWLLGHHAAFRFDLPRSQPLTELDFKLSLPYENQWVKLVLNGTVIFRGVRRSGTPGVFQSRLLVGLRQGHNELEVLTNRSNLDGLGAPFARNDPTDISVGLNQLNFEPVRSQGQALYGLQPSSLIGPAYSSAGPQGLTTLFDRPGPLAVEYRLLRRFEHQGFTFTLDGQPVHTLSSRAPGNLLVGQFTLPAAGQSQLGAHILKVQSNPLPPGAAPFLTTAQDNPEVRFYVQQLSLHEAAPSLQTNLLTVGGLGLLLAAILWWVLLRPQRA